MIEPIQLPRCFDIDAMIIQSMIIDHVMCIIVEKMAFVVNEMKDLLKIRATTSNKHEIQPKAKNIFKIKLVVERNIWYVIFMVKYHANPTATIYVHTARHHFDAYF